MLIPRFQISNWERILEKVRFAALRAPSSPTEILIFSFEIPTVGGFYIFRPKSVNQTGVVSQMHFRPVTQVCNTLGYEVDIGSDRSYGVKPRARCRR